MHLGPPCNWGEEKRVVDTDINRLQSGEVKATTYPGLEVLIASFLSLGTYHTITMDIILFSSILGTKLLWLQKLSDHFTVPGT